MFVADLASKVEAAAKARAVEFAHLALLHAVPTLCLTGLIWLVQLVHYPLFAHVAAADFVAYEREHCRRIGPLVLPLMLAELTLTLWLPFAAHDATDRSLAFAGLGLLAVVWASTFFVQVPCHQRLEQQHDAATIARLVATNGWRTAAWTGRALVAALLLWRQLPAA